MNFQVSNLRFICKHKWKIIDLKTVSSHGNKILDLKVKNLYTNGSKWHAKRYMIKSLSKIKWMGHMSNFVNNKSAYLFII